MRRILAAAAVAGLALVGFAAPASADHYTSAVHTITGDVCRSGELASGTGQSLYTEKAKIKVFKSGVESWTCTFRDVGASTEEENGYFDYAPPTKVVRYTTPDNCFKYGEDDSLLAVGDADITSKPNGTLTLRCTLVPTPS